jgi:hypothetical protein
MSDTFGCSLLLWGPDDLLGDSVFVGEFVGVTSGNSILQTDLKLWIMSVEEFDRFHSAGHSSR